MMNRGYAGYYKNFFLRSSYEYAYARYLDYLGINWKYEERIYDLGFKRYKPDFFIYNDSGILQYIVEIKSRNKEAIDNAQIVLEDLRNKFMIDYKIISYKQLREFYKQLPFSLTSVIDNWINSSETTINKSFFGELNPHHNIKHNETSKNLIGSKTRDRWQDPNIRIKMLEGSRKGAEKIKAKKGKFIKIQREIRNCDYCGMEYRTLITSKQKYCSDKCAGKHGFEKATQVYIAKSREIHELIKLYVLAWCEANKAIILSTPLNKIKTNFEPLIYEIHEKFGVKDIRVIIKSVLEEKVGRKDFLKYLINYVS